MNIPRLAAAMEYIDDDLVSGAVEYKPKVILRQTNRRWVVALVAVLLMLFLVGAGFVAVKYGDSIQNWFRYYWEEITGQNMSEEHNAVIEHLSQEINESQIFSNITVTVDSATVGDDNFFLLLKVDGMDFSVRHIYNFQNVIIETNPDPLEGGGLGGYGIDYLGLDGDGSMLLLLNYEYSSYNGFVHDTRPLEVSLTLQNLIRDAHTDKQKILLNGKWIFSFVIDRSHPPEVVLLPDTEVMAMDLERHEETPIIIKNVELTSTGLRFRYKYDEEDLSLSSLGMVVVLINGGVVDNNGGFGSLTEDNTEMCFSYQWLVPVNLDEVAAIQIGGIQLPVSSR